MDVMPSTVGSLFAVAAVSRDGVVTWGTRVPTPAERGIGTGVYIVALTELDSTEAAAAACPLAPAALQGLLEARPELTLDGERPDAGAVGGRLAAFWCPDEVVVYIGLAGPRRRVSVSELSDRVEEYYTTRLGARGPHAGGWPLKTLANLGDLCVHYAYCDDVEKREQLMLAAFAASLSDETRAALRDPTHVMPFANLEDAQRGRKAHGIKGARAPRARSRAEHSSNCTPPTQRADAPRGELSPLGSVADSSYQTQRVTAGDIQRGIIRIPGPAKVLLPPERGYVEIDLRGGRKSCRWDPRFGPDQERSGVLGIGTALMSSLVAEGQRLGVRVEGNVCYLD